MMQQNGKLAVGRGQFCIFHSIGNLVIYHDGHPTWASNTKYIGHELIM